MFVNLNEICYQLCKHTDVIFSILMKNACLIDFQMRISKLSLPQVAMLPVGCQLHELSLINQVMECK